MVHRYHPALIPINKKIQEDWKLFSNIPDATHLFSKPPISAYRQPPNIKSMLVHSRLTEQTSAVGNTPCNKPRCQICGILFTGQTITPSNSKHTLKLNNYNCDSSNVIYMLICNKCNSGNYVGETETKLRLRLNNHKKSIRDNFPGYSVAAHFNLPDHSIEDMNCVILRGDFNSNKHRQLEEQKMINKLNCCKTGLNRDLSFLAHYPPFSYK